MKRSSVEVRYGIPALREKEKEGRASHGSWLSNTSERIEERGGLSTAGLIFINYINSPRRGQPVDWVTRTTMYVLCPPPPSPRRYFRSSFSRAFSENSSLPTRGQIFMGSLKTWNTGCQRYRNYCKWSDRFVAAWNNLESSSLKCAKNIFEMIFSRGKREFEDYARQTQYFLAKILGRLLREKLSVDVSRDIR